MIILRNRIGIYCKSAITLLTPSAAYVALLFLSPSQHLARALILGFTGGVLLATWEPGLIRKRHRIEVHEDADDQEEENS